MKPVATPWKIGRAAEPIAEIRDAAVIPSRDYFQTTGPVITKMDFGLVCLRAGCSNNSIPWRLKRKDDRDRNIQLINKVL